VINYKSGVNKNEEYRQLSQLSYLEETDRQTEIRRDTEIDTNSEYKNEISFIYHRLLNSVPSLVHGVYNNLSPTTDCAWGAASLRYNGHPIFFLGLK